MFNTFEEFGADVEVEEIKEEEAEALKSDQKIPDEELVSIPGSESPEYLEFVKQFKNAQIKS